MNITFNYKVYDWYWVIGEDAANVWSSRRAASVPVEDADYVAWLETGMGPSRLASMQELRELLAVSYPAGTLETYTAFKRWEKEQGGAVLTSTGMPFKTDDRSQAKISGAYFASQVNPAVVTPWHAADGTIQNLSGPQIDELNRDLITHINNCFSISKNTLDGIANGVITTREQIDAAFEAPISQANKNWLEKP